MRVKEWYSWHFPELAKIVSDNQTFVKLVKIIGDRATSASDAAAIQQIVGDGEIAEKVHEASLNSMGQEISDFDITCLQDLCDKTLRMFEFRKEIQ